MRILIVCVGLPGSGKTTLCEAKKKENPHIVEVLSSDTIGKELKVHDGNGANTPVVFHELYRRMENLPKHKQVVYVDSTALTKKARKKILEHSQKYDIKLAWIFKTPKTECLKRNDKRWKRVPPQVIEKMARRYEPPTIEEGFDDVQEIHTS